MTNTTLSNMYCTQCGKKNIPIRRKKGKEREPGHLKRMWCIYCNKEVNMVEVRDFGTGYTADDFFWEYYNGNFKEDGTRVLEFGQFRDKMNRKEGEENEHVDSDDRDPGVG